MNITKVFFDTEFSGLHQNTTLISIGLISECGKTFYAELNDYDKTQIDDWLQVNVINNLKFKEPKTGEDEYYVATRSDENKAPNDLYKSYSLELRDNKRVVSFQLLQWLEQFEKVEMWSDCLAYDWVLFNQLFGHAFNIPKNVYYIPFDISTMFKLKGIDADISRKEFSGLTTEVEHNSLSDTKMIKACYNKLNLM